MHCLCATVLCLCAAQVSALIAEMYYTEYATRTIHIRYGTTAHKVRVEMQRFYPSHDFEAHTHEERKGLTLAC